MDIEEAQKCRHCDKRSVTFDFIQGILVCQECGRVLHDSELVPQLSFYGSEHRPTGVFVEARDTGLGASGKISQGTKAVKQSRQRDSLAKATKLIQEVSSKLGLTPPIIEQATHFMEQIRASMGSWHHDHLVGAAMYTAIRMNRLPLTLLDLSGVLQRDMYTLGRRYHDALRLLNVRPPQVQPQDLLERTLHRTLVLLGAVSKVGPDSVAAILRDGRLLLEWMEVHVMTRRHPLANVGAAIAISADMNQLPLSVDAIASTLHVFKPSLDQKINQVKQHLLTFAKLLPYGASITLKNIPSHARIVMRMSDMLATSADRPMQLSTAAPTGTLVEQINSAVPALPLPPAQPAAVQPQQQQAQGTRQHTGRDNEAEKEPQDPKEDKLAGQAAVEPAVAATKRSSKRTAPAPAASQAKKQTSRTSGRHKSQDDTATPAKQNPETDAAKLQRLTKATHAKGGVKKAQQGKEAQLENNDAEEERVGAENLTDAEVDEYVRSEEEVQVFRQLYDITTEAGADT